MRDEIKQKFEDLVELILTITIDAVIILFVAAITTAVKWVMENWIFFGAFDASKNEAVKIIYQISEGFLIFLFAIYVIWDVVSLIIKFAKRLKNK